MHARVTRVTGSADRTDQGIQSFRDNVLPAVQQAAGFRGALLLVDRQSGKGIGVSLWESEDDMRASEEAGAPTRQQTTEALGATGQPEVERYEVAVLEMPQS